MPAVKLDQNFINTLACPPGKNRIEFTDADGVPGLYVLVSAATPGIGTFYLRYKDSSGKTCHHKLGRTSEISLLQARKEGRELKAELALGIDRHGTEKAKRTIPPPLAVLRRYLPALCQGA